MSKLRTIIGAALLTAAVTVTAHAQMSTPGQSAKPAPAAAQPSTVDEAKAWTLKKYRAARVEWMKDKAKWKSCRAENKEKKLKGKASWSFLYTCMKS
jgi:hypothetical protein